jgi:hypothetical protein
MSRAQYLWSHMNAMSQYVQDLNRRKNIYNKDLSRVTRLLKEHETSDGATQQELECTMLLWPQP